MTISVFDLLHVGIGPSSSHTVGPMRAAARFLAHLDAGDRLVDVAQIRVDLYGSLAATGRAHGTDVAILLGLEGETPEGVDTDAVPARVAGARQAKRLVLAGRRQIAFDERHDIVLHRREQLPGHPNALVLTATDREGTEVASATYYSVGGGFIAEAHELAGTPPTGPELAHPFSTAEELLERCAESGMSIAEVMLANEAAWRPPEEVRATLLHLWSVMRACVERGLASEGCLPGPLRVRRRAPGLARTLLAEPDASDPLRALDWVNLYALAVSEENAAGGRVVTAPTNGAAGIIPAVLHYYDHFVPGSAPEGVVTFLLTAGAIGLLCKENASISGAEVGCQGEVGSASAMAAAGLCAVLGGSPSQVENAAEIGIEHNLGLTCDPVGGYVQVPCIERNAMGAVKAVNAARMALRGDGTHVVPLDRVLATMRRTGADMKTKYKETARGGLAVSLAEC